MKKYQNTITISLLIIIGLLAGCADNTEEKIAGNTCLDLADCELEGGDARREINIDKLEIIHFHATNQCYSCVAVGDFAEETIKTYFTDELKEGTIVFKHINGQLAKNRDLVMKYGATGSSLWIGTYKGDEFSAKQDIQVWYKLRNKHDFMNYLKEVIEKELAGV